MDESDCMLTVSGQDRERLWKKAAHSLPASSPDPVDSLAFLLLPHSLHHLVS